MKINVTYGVGKNSDILSGYYNVNPNASTVFGVIPLKATQIHEFVDDEEAEEIFFNECLSYYSPKEIQEILDLAFRLLKKGGKIKILDKEASIVAYNYINGKIDLDQYNLILFDGEINGFKKCVLSSNEIEIFLKSKKLHSICSYVIDSNFLVEAFK
ncbi:MAG: hypothetical protein SNJ64_01560 [Endomicrobiia bacterium]